MAYENKTKRLLTSLTEISHVVVGTVAVKPIGCIHTVPVFTHNIGTCCQDYKNKMTKLYGSNTLNILSRGETFRKKDIRSASIEIY